MVKNVWRGNAPAGEGCRGFSLWTMAAASLAVMAMAALVACYLADLRGQIGSLTSELVQSRSRLDSTNRACEHLKSRSDTIDDSIKEIRLSLQSSSEESEMSRHNEDLFKTALWERMERLSDGLHQYVDSLRSSVDTEMALNTAVMAEVRRIKEGMRRDIAAFYQGMLLPSVQVECKGNVGSGTILYSRKHGTKSLTYLLTAWHVVEKAVKQENGKEEREKVKVKMYGDDAVMREAVDADIVSYLEKRDVALLCVESPEPCKYPARLCGRDGFQRLRVFMPIYTVGCPLGHEPLPTAGEIANLNKTVEGEKYYMINAPTIFGNSGGGVFLNGSFEMIGMSNMICTYDGLMSTPVPHLGVIVPMTAIYDWLDSQHLQYVYDPRFDKEACDGDREKARKATPELVKATWGK